MTTPTQQPQQDENPLANLEAKIRAHWLEFCPAMCARLSETQLTAAIKEAAENTIEEVNDLATQYNEQGMMATLLAWETVREKYALLPSENSMPELPTESDPLLWDHDERGA